MIARIVALALRVKWLVFLLAVVLAVAGVVAYHQLDIEAYPNPLAPLVEVITQPVGWSAEEVERLVTVPLEVELAGMPELEHLRSQSLFGLSDVKCYFGWGISYERARQEVINRIGFAELPTGVTSRISPWNPTGEIFRYTVAGKDYSLAERKTAQDWILERQFRQVPGVIGVTGFGGETKQYHVDVDPIRLLGHGASLSSLTGALSSANTNVGGQRLTLGQQSYDVRGIGILQGTRDIGDVVINEAGGTPIRVRDVADAKIGHAPRLGLIGHDDEPDVVEGIILMRYGGKTIPTLQRVAQRINDIRTYHLLPPGMDIVPYYDRGALVKITTHTVIENLLVGMLLVTGILILFLGNARAALIAALNVPLALLVAFLGLVVTGTSANLISLGAIDFGIVVESTVLMTENAFHHFGPDRQGTASERLVRAAGEVGGPMIFSTAIIGTALLPLFTMTGVAGVIFSPMAHTYAFAIGGATLLAITLTPALLSLLPAERIVDKETAMVRFLRKCFDPPFRFAMRKPKTALSLGLLPIVASALLYSHLGGEFMPKLEEGNLWIRATLPASISLEESTKYMGRIRNVIRGCPADATACSDEQRKYPEVTTVVSQVGRPDDGTDVSGFYNIELFAPLRPFGEWPSGVTKASLTESMSQELREQFPGVVFNFSQVISDNVEEALSGVKGENSVKVIGPDLKENEAKANDIVDVMRGIRGVRDLGVFHSLGQPNIKITVAREQAARYGLNSGDVNAVVQAAIGGESVTQLYEGEKHFDVVVRWMPPFRDSVAAMRRITVAAPDGSAIPLGQLATITEEQGPAVIYREDGSRYSPVKFSVRGRDLQSTIDEAQASVRSSVHFPYDMHLQWAGQISELTEALGRLKLVVPATFAIIALLVFGAVRSWVDTAIVFVSIVVACTGGILALLVTGVHFSVSAAMGFISIFGVAIQAAILIISYFQRMRAAGHSIEDAARESADRCFRPVLMTTLVATVGLLPAAVSRGIGSETQKPLAIVVIGGSLLLGILTRLLQPPLMLVVHRAIDTRKAVRKS
jgi:cobalt-zinc-cadmium resistance protein CzcA